MKQNEFQVLYPASVRFVILYLDFSLIKQKQSFLYSLPIYWSTSDQANNYCPETIFVIVQGVPGKRKVLGDYRLVSFTAVFHDVSWVLRDITKASTRTKFQVSWPNVSQWCNTDHQWKLIAVRELRNGVITIWMTSIGNIKALSMQSFSDRLNSCHDLQWLCVYHYQYLFHFNAHQCNVCLLI